MAKYGKVVRIHLGTRPNVAVASPEGFERILSSNRQITKVGKSKTCFHHLHIHEYIFSMRNILGQRLQVLDALAGHRPPN